MQVADTHAHNIAMPASGDVVSKKAEQFQFQIRCNILCTVTALQMQLGVVSAHVPSTKPVHVLGRQVYSLDHLNCNSGLHLQSVM